MSLMSLVSLKRPIEQLKWPQDRVVLALLPLSALQTWYAAQEPRRMVFLGNDPSFKRFWHFAYILPTRFRRYLLKIKHQLLNHQARQVDAC